MSIVGLEPKASRSVFFYFWLELRVLWSVPPTPVSNENWNRTVISLSVLWRGALVICSAVLDQTILLFFKFILLAIFVHFVKVWTSLLFSVLAVCYAAPKRDVLLTPRLLFVIQSGYLYSVNSVFKKWLILAIIQQPISHIDSLFNFNSPS